MGSKRRYRVLRGLFTAGILLFLAAAAVGTARDRGEVSYLENRTLARFPDFTAQGIADGSSFTALDGYLRDHALLREEMLRLSTLLDLKLGRPVIKDVYVGDGLLLSWPGYFDVSDRKLGELAAAEAERIAAHARGTEACGGRYYYIAVPRQLTFYADRLPAYAKDEGEFDRRRAAALFAALEERNVDHIDMGARFEELGDTDRYASRVDNHFTIYGALETVRAAELRINQDTGLGLKVPREEDFTPRVLPNPFLGSRMRTLMGLWHTDEKMIALCPREEIPFERYDLYYGGKEPVESLPQVYAFPAEESAELTYDFYMGGDFPYTEIRTDRPELPDVLIYGDSFTNAVECLLYTGFDTMYSLDLRYYDAMTVDRFIELTRPDLVLCVRDYAALLSDTGNGA